MSDWYTRGAAIAAVLVSVVSLVDGRRRGRRQQVTEEAVARINTERRNEELRPQLRIEQAPSDLFDDYGFTVRIHSECDRDLLIDDIAIIDDPALPSALAGMVASHTTNLVQQLQLDRPLRARGAVLLDLKRRHSLARTNGTGQLRIRVSEPGTDRTWSLILIVQVPWLSGEAPHAG